MMEEKSIVSKANHVGKREVLKKIFLVSYFLIISTSLSANEKKSDNFSIK